MTLAYWSWIDLILIGPFIIAMSFSPQPTLMRVLGAAIMIFNAGFILSTFVLKDQGPQMKPGPSSIGQSKTEFSITPHGSSDYKNGPLRVSDYAPNRT